MNQLRLDPTKTATLRRQFESKLVRRFRVLDKQIQHLLVTEDAFALTVNTRWRFLSQPDKVRNFKKWLQNQIAGGILEVSGETPWMEQFITTAWRKGKDAAYFAARKAKLIAAGVFSPQDEKFLKTSFSGDIPLERLRLIQTRAFGSLQGITEAMAAKLTDAVAEGFMRGLHPTEIARNVTQQIEKIGITRARTLVRTEVIRAHAEGALDTYEHLGVGGVSALAEWLSTPDARRCPQCAALEGQVFTVEQARGLLPRHPNCRCTWIPVFDQKKHDNKKMRAAVRASVAAEKRKGKLKDKLKATTWLGADLG